ncbi:MAG: N-acetyl-gamma-glutamyl-phosphate reductase [Hyphomicrobiaceae bacterium]|jgi:N-acetyl-gamma-glutamyl-phosphate reductase
MATKVFVDGQEGTTGLQIHERLAGRSDLELLTIDPNDRKSVEARRLLLNAADVAVLCLPDVAARESASLVNNANTCVIDASTAHRIDPAWSYGLPELSAAHRSALAGAKRIANPGCHATGFLLAVFPLIQAGVIDRDAALSCMSITGYSGGGKSLIAAHEGDGQLEQREPGSSPSHGAPRMYSLALEHKHIPEMETLAGLTHPPHFNPVVGAFYKGMAVSVPLLSGVLSKALTSAALCELLAEHYEGEHFVRVLPYEATPTLDSGFLDPTSCNGTNRADIHVFGNEKHLQITVVLDNLGKGAGGAAVQNLNLAIGVDETTGLDA